MIPWEYHTLRLLYITSQYVKIVVKQQGKRRKKIFELISLYIFLH